MWHLSINVFEKNPPMELVFISWCSVLGEQKDWGCSLSSGKTVSQGCSQCRRGSVTPQNWNGGQGKNGERGTSPDSADCQTRAWWYGKSGIHLQSPASKGGQQGTSVRWLQPKTGLESVSEAELPVAKFPGDNHKCNRRDATFNNTRHYFKWTGVFISNGITSNLLPSAFLIQISVSKRYRTERYWTDWVYGREFHIQRKPKEEYLEISMQKKDNLSQHYWQVFPTAFSKITFTLCFLVLKIPV